MSNADDRWWSELSDDEREPYHRVARRCVMMQLNHYPWDDRAKAAELLAWAHLENEILRRHTEWLGNLRRRAIAHGREWTRSEFLRLARLHEVGE